MFPIQLINAFLSSHIWKYGVYCLISVNSTGLHPGPRGRIYILIFLPRYPKQAKFITTTSLELSFDI